MKSKWMILLVGCVLAACSKNNVDFSYSPLNPKAGEKIQFTNLSTSGEDWEWSFGDGATSMVKNPSKTYKQAGTYTVTLKVDSKSRWTKTRSITVYDTVPNFKCSVEGADSLGLKVFEDVTFTAQVYNPYNYPVEYEWTVVSETMYTQLSETNTESTFKVYFEQAGTNAAGINMRVTVNGVTRDTTHTYKVSDVKTSSVLMMTSDSTYWRQRIFGKRAEAVYPLADDDAEGKALLEAAQDSVQNYNGKEFRLSEMQQLFPTLLGFNIASRKIYLRTTDGLYVANIDGTCIEPIHIGNVLAHCTDVVNNRLYWALEDSVCYMPLIGSENNKYTTTPTTLNYAFDVVKLAIDPEKR
ncbi:MAG: PKD domain-containing protein [Paludibacteraceae bacterium]|nr:PKD domain-containing protein [Paludibacteraceae bacterium]